MCCRDHDHCDNIPAGQTKYNLTNADFFTRLNCGCDRRFRQCLRDINSTTSNRVGRIYFTLRNKCYFDDHPIVKCEAYDTDVFVKRCIQYQLDMEQPRRYQWFDTPLYRDKKERDAMNDEENYIWIDVVAFHGKPVALGTFEIVSQMIVSLIVSDTFWTYYCGSWKIWQIINAVWIDFIWLRLGFYHLSVFFPLYCMNFTMLNWCSSILLMMILLCAHLLLPVDLHLTRSQDNGLLRYWQSVVCVVFAFSNRFLILRYWRAYWTAHSIHHISLTIISLFTNTSKCHRLLDTCTVHQKNRCHHIKDRCCVKKWNGKMSGTGTRNFTYPIGHCYLTILSWLSLWASNLRFL